MHSHTRTPCATTGQPTNPYTVVPPDFPIHQTPFFTVFSFSSLDPRDFTNTQHYSNAALYTVDSSQTHSTVQSIQQTRLNCAKSPVSSGWLVAHRQKHIHDSDLLAYCMRDVRSDIFQPREYYCSSPSTLHCIALLRCRTAIVRYHNLQTKSTPHTAIPTSRSFFTFYSTPISGLKEFILLAERLHLHVRRREPNFQLLLYWDMQF